MPPRARSISSSAPRSGDKPDVAALLQDSFEHADDTPASVVVDRGPLTGQPDERSTGKDSCPLPRRRGCGCSPQRYSDSAVAPGTHRPDRSGRASAAPGQARSRPGRVDSGCGFGPRRRKLREQARSVVRWYSPSWAPMIKYLKRLPNRPKLAGSRHHFRKTLAALIHMPFNPLSHSRSSRWRPTWALPSPGSCRSRPGFIHSAVKP